MKLILTTFSAHSPYRLYGTGTVSCLRYLFTCQGEHLYRNSGVIRGIYEIEINTLYINCNSRDIVAVWSFSSGR